MQADPNAHVPYYTKGLTLMPGEAHVNLTYEDLFPGRTVPDEVKKAVKHFGEILGNFNTTQLSFDTSVNCPQLPALKTRYTVMT